MRILILIMVPIIFFQGCIVHTKITVTNVSNYEKALGANGKYKSNYLGYNDIFPDSIPQSAEIEDFTYCYYSPWDDNYLGYLVYTCDEEDYQKEYSRLNSLTKSSPCLVYGTTSFPYELCAIYADEYYGLIYAMTDPETRKFIYVELQFCNYFTDIDYEKIISQEYLPINFNATLENDVRKNFDKEN